MKLNIKQIEHDILKYWKKNNFFEKSVEMRSSDDSFVFYDGPPFATGLPHHGSLLASVIKDLIPRYKTMRGYQVKRVWGWDCHGLPVENLVEKNLGLNSKKDIEELGVEKFTNACRASVLKYDQEWKEYIDRIGRWIDMENSYKTMDNSYIESVWWGFKQIYDKGLAYEGRHISLYCPRCSTPLSNFEIAMDNSYQEVDDHSTYVKFPVKEQEKTYFVAWTTTPWTLPGNVALVIDKGADYVLAQVGDEKYYLAQGLVEKVFENQNFIILENMKGEDLRQMEYTPLYPYMKLDGKRAYYIEGGDFVSLEDGTGIVHTAAVFGEDDFAYAKKYDLPVTSTLNEEGKFLDFVTPFAGMFYKDAEQPIVDDLQKRGLLLKDKPYKHSYPFCWRCETPLYYNAVPAWFIKVSEIKQRMLELNDKINWYPEHLKEGRFKYGLENAPDWNVSRNRYWGTPIPVWECENKDCGNVEVIGSFAELKEKSGIEPNDVHLPAIGKHEWICSKCRNKMRRVSQVFDCWVESGSMPFASIHYPFENKEFFEKNFPGEFIAEYIAQTRGWFYTLHVLSTAIFGKPSFVHAVTTGTIMAEDGSKMSKSKQNYTDPLQLFDQYGADAERLYLMASPVMQGENINFSDDGVKEVMRKVIMMLGNIYSLYSTYDNELATGNPSGAEIKSLKLTFLDKWFLARWHNLLSEVTEKLDHYDVVKPARMMIDFIDEFSTWYLRRSRDRFKGGDEDDKKAALKTTRYVLENLLLILAPYTPFFTEYLFQQFYPEQGKSVHLQDWPELISWMKNDEAVGQMQAVRDIVEAALGARAQAGIKVRQVCENLLVKLPSGMTELHKEAEQLIMDEVNVKNVQVAARLEEQPGYLVHEGARAGVSLKIELSEELLKEGFVREAVRQINFLRKQGGLSVEDRIVVHYQTDSEFLENALTEYVDEIKKQTLSEAILPEALRGDLQSKINFNESSIQIGINKQ